MYTVWCSKCWIKFVCSHFAWRRDQSWAHEWQGLQPRYSKRSRVGVDFKMSKTQICHIGRKGSSLFSTLVSLGTKMLSMTTNIALKVLPELATGALSSLGNFGMERILGQGQKIRTRTREVVFLFLRIKLINWLHTRTCRPKNEMKFNENQLNEI